MCATPQGLPRLVQVSQQIWILGFVNNLTNCGNSTIIINCWRLQRQLLKDWGQTHEWVIISCLLALNKYWQMQPCKSRFIKRCFLRWDLKSTFGHFPKRKFCKPKALKLHFRIIKPTILGHNSFLISHLGKMFGEKGGSCLLLDMNMGLGNVGK